MVLHIHPYVQKRINNHDHWNVFSTNLDVAKDYLSGFHNGEGEFSLHTVRYNASHSLDFNQMIITDVLNQASVLIQFQNFKIINVFNHKYTY